MGKCLGIVCNDFDMQIHTKRKQAHFIVAQCMGWHYKERHTVGMNICRCLDLILMHFYIDVNSGWVRKWCIRCTTASILNGVMYYHHSDYTCCLSEWGVRWHASVWNSRVNDVIRSAVVGIYVENQLQSEFQMNSIRYALTPHPWQNRITS